MSPQFVNVLNTTSSISSEPFPAMRFSGWRPYSSASLPLSVLE